MTEARRSLYDNAPFVALTALYVFVGAIVLRSVGREIPYTFTEIYRGPALLTGLYLGVVFLVAVGRDVLLARRAPFERSTWSLVWRKWFGTRRMVGTIIVFATLPALLDVMLGFRLALTDIKPFAYDRLFMEWDRWLHVGTHPWELLHPVLGHPAVTVVIDRTYVFGWFFILWAVAIWQAVHGREPIRLQFLLSFGVSWALLGTIAAIALSSAGPAFFGGITGSADPFAPLMSYLGSVDAQTPLHALENQERLRLTYRTWGGMTAMPSMHLAITTVVALTAIRSHRWLSIIVVPLWLAMLLGSIHLGWHYAIDSYAGILGAAVIWVACGRFSSWWEGRTPAELRQPT